MSAPVTESHKRLVATIVERAFRFAEGNHKITPELGKLIADSEARATDQLRAEVERLKSDGAASAFSNMACRASRAETERNNLRADLDAIKAILTEEKARAERAEAELKEWSLLNLWGGTPEIVHAFVKGQQARIHAAQDVEAELAAERARLDWLEKRGPWESFNKWGETGISLRENIRAAIDAAMKEGAK